MQLLGTTKVCPSCEAPLPHENIDTYRPNFALMHVIAAFNRDAAQDYRLRDGQLRYEATEENLLGEGGSGKVYRGACHTMLRRQAPRVLS
jgi:hypothetical protein